MQLHLEFHDSTLSEVGQDDDRVMLRLDAYVHRWEQIHGAWNGVGVIQEVRIVLEGCPHCSVGPVPVEIADGTIRAGDAVHDNLVPVPFSHNGPVSVTMEFETGAEVQIQGQGIGVTAIGDGRFVEDLPSEWAPEAV